MQHHAHCDARPEHGVNMPASNSPEQNQNGMVTFQGGRAERQSLLEQWRAAPQPRDQSCRHRRYDFDDMLVPIDISHPGGGTAHVEVILVNLSAGGCCIIHRGYLHPSTKCTLELRTFDGALVSSQATTAWCQFLRGQYHTTGLEWDSPIQPRDFVDPRVWLELSQHETPQTTESLEGRLLLLTHDPMQGTLVQMLLRGSNATLDTFDSSGSALDAVRSGGFDVVIVDTDNTDIDVESVPSRLKDEGYSGPLLALTRDTGPTIIESLRRSGYNETLLKPLSQSSFIMGIHMAIEHFACAVSGTGAIESTLKTADDAAKWVSTYITQVQAMAKTLEEAARADDTDVARDLCDSIRDSGASYGFPLLTEVANTALTAVNASASAKESMSCIRQLIRVIERLAASGSQGSPPSENAA